MARRPGRDAFAEQVRRTREVRRAVVAAIFAEDEYLDRLALKGAGALELVYGLDSRASLDIDLSCDGKLGEDQEALRAKFLELLTRRFAPDGLYVFDLEMAPRPPRMTPGMEGFWGGYHASFKLIEEDKRAALREDPEAMRRDALVVSVNNQRTIEIDISHYEYLGATERIDVDGYLVNTYRPVAIVFEKLRAICQQFPEYGRIVLRNREGAPRARDFFDIEEVRSRFTDISPCAPENIGLLRRLFGAKRVPLPLLSRIDRDECREFHRMD